jgi:uncharacterized protein YkwD
MRSFAHSKRRTSAVSAVILMSGLLTAVAMPASSVDAAVSTTATTSRSNEAPATDTSGYSWVNYFRGMAGEGTVSRNATMEAQERTHVQYLANHAQACETNVHDELTKGSGSCRANPYATAGGKLAANNSNITRVSAAVSDRTAVSNWFTSAFHALTLLDPRLKSTGYAAYYTPTPKGAKPLAWAFTAGVDVYRGRTGTYTSQTISFPGNRATTPLLAYTVGTESPEPFATSTGACRSWSSKSVVSAPIIVQRPKASRLPLTGGSIVDVTTGKVLPTCTLTAASYPAGTAQRQFLDGSNGITKSAFYYASTPFMPGHKYTLRVSGVGVTTFATTALPAGPKPTLTARPQAAIATWTPASPGSGAISYYQLREYTTAACNTKPRATMHVLGTKAGVIGLAARHTYWIQIMAVNTANSGRAGACVPVTAR